MPRRGILCLMLLLLPTLAWAVLPVGEQWREEIIGNFGGVDRRVGYGRNATGGAGGTLCTVSNLNDSGAGSLRSCMMAAGAQWIIFSVSGTINLNTQIEANPSTNGHNKTIDGRGASITITSATTNGTPALLLNGVNNWIILNTSWRISTIGNPNGSFLLRILCSKNIWMDHLDIAGAGTSLASLSIGAHGGWCTPDADTDWSGDITISYSKFHTRCYISPTLCSSGHIVFGTGSVGNPGGNPNPDLGMVNGFMTLHHNWYQMSAHVRFPMMRFGRNHSFNNYLDNTDQGMIAQENGQYLSEHDIFDCTDGYGGVCNDTVGWVCKCGATGGALPRVRCFSAPNLELDAANCKVTNPWLVEGGETYQQVNPGTIFNPAAAYSYTLETADAALMAKITNPTMGAGHVSNPYNYLAAGDAQVGGWKLDETSGLTAADSSGNNFTGTLTNMETPGDWVAGKIGGALLFDGVGGASGEYVTIPDQAVLSPATTGQFSVCAWIFPTSLPAFGVFVGKGTSGQFEYALYVQAAGTVRFTVYSPSGSIHADVTSAAMVSTSVWSHVCGTYESTVETKIYLAGTSSGTSTTFTSTIADGTSPVNFGRRPDDVSYYAGRLDDVQMFNYALTPAQVLAMFQSAPGLIVKLVMNDGTGNTVADTSGNSLNGQRCEGATCPAAGPTWVPNYLLFDGVNDGVRIAHNALLNFTGDFTIGFWINRDAMAGGMAAKAGAAQSPYDWVFWIESNTLCFAGGGLTPSLLCSTVGFTDTTNEHLVAVTRAGTVLTFWLDGVPLGSNLTITGTMTANTVPVWFGNDQFSYFNGLMRDARLYSGAISAAEMTAWAAEGLTTGPPAAPTNLRVMSP